MPPHQRICVVRNPGSGSADDAALLLEAAEARDDLTLVETEGAEETERAVLRATAEGFDVIAAAGGDGTVHAVANALMAAGATAEARPILAVLPFGTGNDLARTLAVPLDPNEALALIGYGERRTLDLIHLCPTEGGACYAVNLASGGFTAEIRAALSSDLKKRWGPLAYVIASIETLPNATVYNVRLCRDDGLEERLALHNLVVASGRTAGGGRPAAPLANPEDGLLDLVAVHKATALARTALGFQAALGDYLQSEHVSTWQARRVTVASVPCMEFAVDGEMKAQTPLTFEVVPHALRVVVGEGYAANVNGEAPG